MGYKLAVLIVSCLAYLQIVAGDCYSEYNSCSSCTDSPWWSRCRWCPLTDACHMPFSVYNDCYSSQQVVSSDRSKCLEVKEPELNYDSGLAAVLAKFSSLAYVTPEDYDMNSIQNKVHELIGSTYQVVEVVSNDCDTHFEFANCSAVIAKSSVERKVVVAFRGTSSVEQLFEQAIEVFDEGLEPFAATGGKVLVYNSQLHSSLYPCVKSIVQELLAAESLLQVVVTGHSLGGAQAQLAAASLIDDRVVPRSRLLLYTFGSPRVGDRDFAYGYDRNIGNSWRVILKDDPVPQVIPKRIVGFIVMYHTRREVYYDTEGEITPSTRYRICQGNEDENYCSLSNWICLSNECLNIIHQKYFVNDLPTYMSRGLTAGTPPSRRSRGQCTSYIFS